MTGSYPSQFHYGSIQIVYSQNFVDNLAVLSQFHYGSIQMNKNGSKKSFKKPTESQFHYGSIQISNIAGDMFMFYIPVSIPLWFNSNPD